MNTPKKITEEQIAHICGLLGLSVEDLRKALPPAEKDRLYSCTRQEFIKRIPISLPTLDRHLKDGKIKSVRVGDRVLIPMSEVERLLSPQKNAV